MLTALAVSLSLFARPFSPAGPLAPPSSAPASAASAPATVALTAPAGFPAEAELQAMLRTRIEALGAGAIVVGLLSSGGARFLSAGTIDGKREGRPADADTLFEIGSISKVFTSTLLGEMIERGEVAPDEAITALLPPGVRAPATVGATRPISLADLASHRSGLPRMPTNYAPSRSDDPYADYTAELLFAGMGSLTLARPPGAGFEYSNLGVGLLGELLARRTGKPYDEIMRERVLLPLGLRDTTARVADADAWRFAQGHNSNGTAAPHWNWQALAGCGAWRSTAKDMVKFASASMSPQDFPLGRGMRSSQRPRAETDIPGTQIGLGWLVRKKNDRTILWHNGGTGGFHSWLGIDPDRRLGVVVLSSAAGSVDDVGMHLLDPNVPLQVIKPLKPRTDVTLKPADLEPLVGTYRLAPEFQITITREGAQLIAQATAQGRIAVYAEGPRAFFYKAVDAQITFEADATGKIVRLVLHQNGRDMPGERVK